MTNAPTCDAALGRRGWSEMRERFWRHQTQQSVQDFERCKNSGNSSEVSLVTPLTVQRDSHHQTADFAISLLPRFATTATRETSATLRRFDPATIVKKIVAISGGI